MAAGNDSSLARVRESVPHRLSQYRVRPGDTVDLIADRFNVTAYQIRRWNGLKSSKLTPGRTLRIYVEGRATTARTSHPRTAARSKHPPPHATTAQKKPAAPRSPPRAAAALTTHLARTFPDGLGRAGLSLRKRTHQHCHSHTGHGRIPRRTRWRDQKIEKKSFLANIFLDKKFKALLHIVVM
jgi:LysM repeat protein